MRPVRRAIVGVAIVLGVLLPRTTLRADRACKADRIRKLVRLHGARDGEAEVACLCPSPRHSGSPATRNPSSTLSMLLLNAAVPIVGPKVFKVVFGHSLR